MLVCLKGEEALLFCEKRNCCWLYSLLILTETSPHAEQVTRGYAVPDWSVVALVCSGMARYTPRSMHA